VHCIAHLDQDIAEVIPYLNAVLGGFQFIKDPVSVSFKLHGKLIAIHGRKICVNALRDEARETRLSNGSNKRSTTPGNVAPTSSRPLKALPSRGS